MILSNELPGAFSVHKVILTTTAGPEVAFAAPKFSQTEWTRIRSLVSPSLAGKVEAGDADIEKTFVNGALKSLQQTNFGFDEEDSLPL